MTMDSDLHPCRIMTVGDVLLFVVFDQVFKLRRHPADDCKNDGQTQARRPLHRSRCAPYGNPDRYRSFGHWEYLLVADGCPEPSFPTNFFILLEFKQQFQFLYEEFVVIL